MPHERNKKNDDEEYFVISPYAVDRIHRWYENRCFVYDNQFLQKEEDDEVEALPEVIETAIQQYSCRIILIDNLMTAIDDDMTSDLYRQQSGFVRKLSIIAKKFDVIVFLVVHPRKTSTDRFTNDDIAGSSNITNLADVILRYSKPSEDKTGYAPCDRILQVTKNRLDGRLEWDGIKLWFDERSKRISDDPDKFDWEVEWEVDAENAFEDIGEDEDIRISCDFTVHSALFFRSCREQCNVK